MRTLVRIVLGLVVLVPLAVVVFLVPPHLQTRGIEPPLPSAGELRSLLAVDDGPVAVRYLNTASQDVLRGSLGHTVFLAEWADGRMFMIDAGMDRAAAAEFAELTATLMGAGEARFHGDVAEQLGGDVARVRGVGLTHLHVDHSQGIGAFCAARGAGAGAAVWQTPWQAEEHNFNTWEGAGIVEESCLEARRLEGDGVAQPEGFPGLGVVALGGHTPGSTLFAVAAGGRLWLFSGDITNSKAAILDDLGKGFVYSTLMVPENTARTGELRRWLAALDGEPDMTVIVSHDLDDIVSIDLAEYRAGSRAAR